MRKSSDCMQPDGLMQRNWKDAATTKRFGQKDVPAYIGDLYLSDLMFCASCAYSMIPHMICSEW